MAGRIPKSFIDELIARADIVVSLTESMSRWLAGRLGGAAPEMLVIPNPLPGTPQPRRPVEALPIERPAEASQQFLNFAVRDD